MAFILAKILKIYTFFMTFCAATFFLSARVAAKIETGFYTIFEISPFIASAGPVMLMLLSLVVCTFSDDKSFVHSLKLLKKNLLSEEVKVIHFIASILFLSGAAFSIIVPVLLKELLNSG